MDATRQRNQLVHGFTLIELLVVIAVVVLLMTLLMPALQRARNQARTVVCQANLRQWGMLFTLYMNDHDGNFISHDEISRWPDVIRAGLYQGKKDILLCPMAARPKPPAPDVSASFSYIHSGAQLGSKFGAWIGWEKRRSCATSATGYDWISLKGSYGLNYGTIEFYGYANRFDQRASQSPLSAPPWTPMLLDCVWQGVSVFGHDEPPEFEGALLPVVIGPYQGRPSLDMKAFCINRHNGGVNGLFIDTSVRKVGLKELWTLNWRPGCWQKGPWTAAGGVLPEDWPAWMRPFKNYTVRTVRAQRNR